MDAGAAGDANNGWCTIESDPGVFTELCDDLGVKDVQFKELYSLDEDTLKLECANVPVYGLVFLFKWDKEVEDKRTPLVPPPDGMFYASQVINNACATQAILSVLLNAEGLDIGEVLTNLRDFTAGFDADTRGWAIGNSEEIRRAHNSFRPQASFDVEQREEGPKEDAFHFVAYVPFQGGLYELDGLRGGPVFLEATDSDWAKDALKYVQEKIAKFSKTSEADEIRFNLMVVCGDKIKALRKQIDQLSTAMDESSADVVELKAQLENEQNIRAKWKAENERRRHDYTPFLLTALRLLAEKGQLMDAFKTGKETSESQRSSRRQADKSE
ncbi:ubiquitin carboxyl-terminal hydrolase isozyme L5, putative [Perkinsus marinus ATCC 50983]|uniref:Ubiquitin carboxyl-terminal hydrolase n=1 Tax=Perkinsus marinus (strain ATCC 50983 / TXsc) TaxID=423536 RepID=C5KCB9_PERM5|nr:ubiquitin carboxyl-terminal hydrolase isozyme L5, putative [Perkinsus marinus ATCC 50983]EER17932.1 ubiquitin carboxyl-terminal hydrolase isozyme L5, putative [Perkinsus marinus ATCC 50983]|eukprot:XP_002786136.1 ubiquitin carboxyl-terminal hydrolase isozyme L5, putative [Perkinsus marinus ATCC 50983]